MYTAGIRCVILKSTNTTQKNTGFWAGTGWETLGTYESAACRFQRKGENNRMGKIYDLIIAGSGPAGLAAAIYAKRAELDTLVIEKEMMSGGQILSTYEVDNYPGLPGSSGFDLGMKFREHADRLGAVFTEDCIEKAELLGEIKTLYGQKETYQARTVIIATGASHRKLGIPGEEELLGSGVSYCATGDGAFFKDKTAAVIGGGDVALEDAIFLSRLCRKVHLIHRRDELRGARTLQKQVFESDKIEVHWDTVADAIEGDGRVERLALTNRKTGEKTALETDGVFIAVGIEPESGLFSQMIETDRQGYLAAGEDGVTSVPGVFAAGDVRTKQLRQVLTAASDGANCVTSVERYLAER